MEALRITPAVLVEPVDQTADQITRLYQWALRQGDDPVSLGVIAAVRWLTGRLGTGPVTDRPTPEDLLQVRTEYAFARGAVRDAIGSTARQALGVSLVLAVATGDLGGIPDLLDRAGASAPLRSSITRLPNDTMLV
jgi:hypothetical protein